MTRTYKLLLTDLSFTDLVLQISSHSITAETMLSIKGDHVTHGRFFHSQITGFFNFFYLLLSDHLAFYEYVIRLYTAKTIHYTLSVNIVSSKSRYQVKIEQIIGQLLLRKLQKSFIASYIMSTSQRVSNFLNLLLASCTLYAVGYQSDFDFQAGSDVFQVLAYLKKGVAGVNSDLICRHILFDLFNLRKY